MIKKSLLVLGIALLFISINFTQPTSALLQDNVRIRISAGVVRQNFGRFGLGWILFIKNFGREHSVPAYYEYEYFTESGEILGRVSKNVTVGPLGVQGIGEIKLFFSLEVVYIRIYAEVEGLNASKTGRLFGPFVLILS
jgi:hypothetical protein